MPSFLLHLCSDFPNIKGHCQGQVCKCKISQSDCLSGFNIFAQYCLYVGRWRLPSISLFTMDLFFSFHIINFIVGDIHVNYQLPPTSLFSQVGKPKVSINLSRSLCLNPVYYLIASLSTTLVKISSYTKFKARELLVFSLACN